jgi:hypothetical protein
MGLGGGGAPYNEQAATREVSSRTKGLFQRLSCHPQPSERAGGSGAMKGKRRHKKMLYRRKVLGVKPVPGSFVGFETRKINIFLYGMGGNKRNLTSWM